LPGNTLFLLTGARCPRDPEADSPLVWLVHCYESMSVFSNFMLRCGWIQLSRYGLEMSETGQLRGPSIGAALPPQDQSPPMQLQMPQQPVAFVHREDLPKLNPALLDTEPQLSSLPNTTQAAAPTTPQAQVPAVLPAVETAEDEDERAWQEAMARAKAASDSEFAVADTDQVPAIVTQTPVSETLASETLVQIPTMPTETEAEEDWDALIAAANQRAADDGLPALSDFVTAPATHVPAMGAQVEQDATPANDDMPANLVTSIHRRRLAAPSPQVQVAQPIAEEEDWATLKADAEAKARSEKVRKERAMREIRRLQRKPMTTGLGAPPRRRLAAGTKNGARAAAPPIPTAIPLRQRPAATSQSSATQSSAMAVGDSTQVDLPRITQRFSS